MRGEIFSLLVVACTGRGRVDRIGSDGLGNVERGRGDLLVVETVFGFVAGDGGGGRGRVFVTGGRTVVVGICTRNFNYSKRNVFSYSGWF